MHALPHTLALSLQDDPFYRAVSCDFAGQPDARLACLTTYMQLAIDEAAAAGRWDRLGDDAGALWALPGNPARSAAAAQHKRAALQQCLGPQGLQHYAAICTSMEALLPATLPQDSWYLSILGVNPAQQGAGLGGRVMAPALQAADAQGASCYIETFNARSVAFYERHGFTQVFALHEPVTGADFWTMVRAPR